MEIENAILSLGALAQETRLAIYRRLVKSGVRGMAAGKLADEMGVPAATLSFHLKELSHAGLVSSTRNGRSIIYTPNFNTMSGLIQFLTENCCQDDQCCPPQQASKEH